MALMIAIRKNLNESLRDSYYNVSLPLFCSLSNKSFSLDSLSSATVRIMIQLGICSSNLSYRLIKQTQINKIYWKEKIGFLRDDL